MAEKDTGKKPEIEFTFDTSGWGSLTPRQVNVLYRGVNLEACAPLLAQLVVGCNRNIGSLDDPDTYLDRITMDQWNALIEQLGDAIKNG